MTTIENFRRIVFVSSWSSDKTRRVAALEKVCFKFKNDNFYETQRSLSNEQKQNKNNSSKILNCGHFT